MPRREMVDQYLQTLGLQGRDLDFGLLTEVVARRRGGYCFEQNGLLFDVLEELGFSPELYLARVIYNKDIHPGLTHRISVIQHQGQRYVLDVGFGFQGPRVPVLLSQRETKDGDKTFRIAEPQPGEYHMQMLKDGEFFSLYRFELARYGQADCEVGHFYSHRHPDTSFVNHLVVLLILTDETRSLRDLEYSVITGSGMQSQKISGPEQLRRILVEELGVQVTEAECRRLFEGLDNLQEGAFS